MMVEKENPQKKRTSSKLRRNRLLLSFILSALLTAGLLCGNIVSAVAELDKLARWVLTRLQFSESFDTLDVLATTVAGFALVVAPVMLPTLCILALWWLLYIIMTWVGDRRREAGEKGAQEHPEDHTNQT